MATVSRTWGAVYDPITNRPLMMRRKARTSTEEDLREALGLVTQEHDQCKAEEETRATVLKTR